MPPAETSEPDGAAATALLLLLTDRRWRNATRRLIRRIEESDLLPSDQFNLLAQTVLTADAQVYWEVPADVGRPSGRGQVSLGVPPVLPFLVEHDEEALPEREVLELGPAGLGPRHPDASRSGVSDSITPVTIARRLRRTASTASSGGRTSRSHGMPSQPGASSHGRSSRCHGDGSQRIIRPTPRSRS
jgi:hypothetical protein